MTKGFRGRGQFLKSGIVKYGLGGGLATLAVVIALAATPLPSITPSPTAQPSPKVLMREFQRAQRTQLRALQHRHSLELKELRSSQDARYREFKKRETEARHKFFAEHTKGPERRDYIQDFRKRESVLFDQFEKEKQQKKTEHEAQLAAIKKDQAAKFGEFKKAVHEGKTPAAALWN